MTSAFRNLPDPDDEMPRAVVGVAAEIDARRTWWKQLRDAIRTANLLFAIIWHTKVRRNRGAGGRA